jgi:hypothetical protein
VAGDNDGGRQLRPDSGGICAFAVWMLGAAAAAACGLCPALQFKFFDFTLLVFFGLLSNS